jgi:hypothetical protein
MKKWRLEREAQRDRDREMWAREDRHRFTEQRRKVYVDFQIAEHELFDYLQIRAAQLDDEIDPERFNAAVLKRTDPLLSRISSGLAELQLIAPEDVYRTAGRLSGGLESIRESIADAPFSGADAKSIASEISTYLDVGQRLAHLMREDVTPGDALTGVW